ncbi:hypothetical protein [Geodermatophilus sp. SYSU D00815]
MRTSKLLLAGAGIAAATAVGSAFTAGNSLSASVAGYGESTVSGTTVNDIDFTHVTADASRLDVVTFTTDQDNSNRVARLTLKQGTTQVGTSPYNCTITTTTIVCDLGDNPLIASFDTVGLTVVDKD